MSRKKLKDEDRIPEQDQALASEQQWWQVGHELNEASKVIARWKKNGRFTTTMNVGGPIARILKPRGFGHGHRRQMIAEMLYSFAVEDWLKGLLVESYKRASREEKEVIGGMVGKLIGDVNIRDGEKLTRLIVDALDTPEIATALDAAHKLEEEENRERVDAAMEHVSHHLDILAQAAGVQLGEAEITYLKVLSQVNQLGRYPALKPTRPTMQFDLSKSEEVRESLNKAIHARYDSLITIREVRVFTSGS